MENQDFAIRQRFPDAASIFQDATKSPEEIKSDCLVVLDTNVLVAPYGASSRGLDELKKVYQHLIEQGRLVIPAHVAREFAKTRSEKLHNIHQKLQRRKSEKPRLHSKGGAKDDPVIREIEGFDELEQAADKVEEAWKEYDSVLQTLIEEVRSWNWNDPVSQLYDELFSNDVIAELNKSDEEVRKEFRRRVANKIPPGYKDSNKEENEAGDLIIWLTILNVAEAKDADVVFVTRETKGDWWIRSENVVLCPRYELVNEFALRTRNRSFHLMKIGDFLRLFDVEEEVVDELEQEAESVGKKRFLHELRDLEENRFSGEDEFVSLNYLIKSRLGKLGYDYSASSEVAEQLQRDGKVKISKKENPHGPYPTTVIETKQNAT